MSKKYPDQLDPKSEVNEPLVAYATTVMSERSNDPLYIIKSINSGISYRTYARIREKSPFSDEMWSLFLQVSTKTMERYAKSNCIFKPLQSEKILELAEFFAIGLEYFEDVEKFRVWLQTPNFGLGQQRPLDLLTSSYGKNLVLDILVSAEHGVFI